MSRRTWCGLVGSSAIAMGVGSLAACASKSPTSTSPGAATTALDKSTVSTLVAAMTTRTPKTLVMPRLAEGLTPPTNHWFTGLVFGDQAPACLPDAAGIRADEVRLRVLVAKGRREREDHRRGTGTAAGAVGGRRDWRSGLGLRRGLCGRAAEGCLRCGGGRCATRTRVAHDLREGAQGHQAHRLGCVLRLPGPPGRRRSARPCSG